MSLAGHARDVQSGQGAAGLGPLSEVNVKEVSSNILCEFMEVAFHLILYIREIYPSVLFERRRKYNVPVHMCVHPELNQYIRDVLVSVRPLLEEGALNRIELAVHSKEHKVVERFVFHMQGLSEDALSKDGYMLQLERDLRAVLLKISVCDALLQPNPPDCTFSVLVHTTQSAATSMDHLQATKDFPWVTADHTLTPDVPGGTVVPLKSVSSSILQMQLCVVQAPVKSTEP